MAPTKVLLVPLSGHKDLVPFTQKMRNELRKLRVSSKVDDGSASIGKRYSRNDELGTPFGVTVDFQTIKDNTYTLRERDTTKQVRASAEEICKAITNMLDGNETWEDVMKRLPVFEGQELEQDS